MGLRKPVDIISVLGPGYSQILSEETMLRDTEEMQEEFNLAAPGMYLDEVFRRDEKSYLSFLGDLVKIGLVGCVPSTVSQVAPFFVEKKSGNLRLIWDCRRANRRFREPPGLDMGAGDVLQGVDVPPGATLLAAQADVANCYYQCSLPLWLRVYFGIKRVPVQVAREMGLNRFDSGDAFPLQGEVALCLMVFPMDWSWAFWVIQRLHEELAQDA